MHETYILGLLLMHGLIYVSDVEFESYQLEQHNVNGNSTNDSHDRVYMNLPKKHHVLRKVSDCRHCGALRFQYEGPAFCCIKGKVDIFTPEGS